MMWLNTMSSDKGISEKYSPREIIKVWDMDYTKYRKEILGGYFESSEDEILEKNMKPWTHECMLLGPSSNIQGYTKYFDTLKGRVLKHSKIEELPMPVRVIRKIYQWVIIFKQE